jgi:hypothetical protein
LRETAEWNIEKVRKEIRNRLLSKGKVINKNFEKETIVTISIPQIDRYSVDRPLLPCKIVEKTNGKYRLGCASGILNDTYGANELNLVKAVDFPELDNIPQRTVSLREAAKGQSVVRAASNSQVNKCNCKGHVLMVDVVIEKPSRVVQRNVIKIVLIVLIIKLY